MIPLIWLNSSSYITMSGAATVSDAYTYDVKKKARKEAYTSRAKQEFGEWIAGAEAVIA